MKTFALVITLLSLLSPTLAQERFEADNASEEKALLYFVRTAVPGFVFTTTCNNELIGLTEGGDYLYKLVEPGTVDILTAGGEGHQSLAINVEAGQVYFVKIYHKIGFIAPSVGMKLMDTTWGRKRLETFKLGKLFTDQSTASN